MKRALVILAGAKVAADKLRQETDDKARGLLTEASKRADSLVASARRQAEAAK
jgi:vacuolar-type H+-ATPase subunit H